MVHSSCTMRMQHGAGFESCLFHRNYCIRDGRIRILLKQNLRILYRKRNYYVKQKFVYLN